MGELGDVTRMYLTHDDVTRNEMMNVGPLNLNLPVGPGWYVEKVSGKAAWIDKPLAMVMVSAITIRSDTYQLIDPWEMGSIFKA